MERLDDKLLQGALGEKRFNPDEQRHYLVTYAERVVLSLPLENAQDNRVKDYLESELPNLALIYQPLTLKISSLLAPNYQMLYMKLAKQYELATTIVTEKHMTSPFAFVLHTDHVVNLDETRLEVILTQTEDSNTIDQPADKPKTFWQKLFH